MLKVPFLPKQQFSEQVYEYDELAYFKEIKKSIREQNNALFSDNLKNNQILLRSSSSTKNGEQMFAESLKNFELDEFVFDEDISNHEKFYERIKEKYYKDEDFNEEIIPYLSCLTSLELGKLQEKSGYQLSSLIVPYIDIPDLTDYLPYISPSPIFLEKNIEFTLDQLCKTYVIPKSKRLKVTPINKMFVKNPDRLIKYYYFIKFLEENKSKETNEILIKKLSKTKYNLLIMLYLMKDSKLFNLYYSKFFENNNGIYKDYSREKWLHKNFLSTTSIIMNDLNDKELTTLIRILNMFSRSLYPKWYALKSFSDIVFKSILPITVVLASATSFIIAYQNNTWTMAQAILPSNIEALNTDHFIRSSQIAEYLIVIFWILTGAVFAFFSGYFVFDTYYSNS